MIRERKARSKEEAKAVLRSLNVPEFDPDESNLNLMNQIFLFEYKEGGKIKLELAYRPKRHYANGVFEVFLNDANSAQKTIKFTDESSFKSTFLEAKNWALQQLERL